MTSDIAKKLMPTHLADLDEMKTEIDESINPQKPNVNLDDPKLKPQYTFDFNYIDGQGKIWEGKFTNKILTIGDRANVGILRSRLSGNVPLESLDALTSEINLIIAHLSYSLADKPKWAEDLRKLHDIRLLQEIYAEVDSHEATFFGYRNNEGAGE